MNSDQVKFTNGGVMPPRRLGLPLRALKMDSLKNEFFSNGQIFSSLGKQRFLSIIDEQDFSAIAFDGINGVSVDYVDDTLVLFEASSKEAVLLDKKNPKENIKTKEINELMILLFKRNSKELLFKFELKNFGMFAWPSMQCLWVHNTEGLSRKANVVYNDVLYIIHRLGYQKVALADGVLVGEKNTSDWLSHPFFMARNQSIIEIASESTGIFNNVLLLVLKGNATVGVDVESGDIRWAHAIGGPESIKITHDGIAFIITTDEIQRIDMTTGDLLPAMPIQYAPVLDKNPRAHLGAYDISETHVVASVAARTSEGTRGHVVGINRGTGVVEWAEPLDGMATKLMIINNRVYATGMMLDPVTLKPTSQTLIIEGEGGYIPD